MPSFKKIDPGHAFMWGGPDGLTEINKFYIKNDKTSQDGTEGTASSFWFTHMQDGTFTFRPTGEPDKVFKMEQWVAEILLHEMEATE